MNKNFKLLLILFLSSCSFAPDYKRPKMEMPSFWQKSKNEISESDKKQIAIDLDWWKQFEDPKLDELVLEALKNNADLLTAAARVSEARAILAQNDSSLYPRLTGNGGFTRRSNSTRIANAFTNPKPYNDFNLSLVLSYEIDLWGKLRNASKAAKAQLLSSMANRDAIRLAVASEVAIGYFNLLTLDKQIIVTQNTIKSRKEAYDYQKKQYDLGGVEFITFRQAEAELEAANAALPSLKQVRQEQKTALLILLGRDPKQIVEDDILSNKIIDELPNTPQIPEDLPSSLIERRPDIQASEQNLIGSGVNIGVAKAGYFPSLSLSTLIGLGSSRADTLLERKARYWNGGALTSVPLIDFGRAKSAVDIAKSQEQQAEFDYQSTVRKAFKEVIDALNAQENSSIRSEALEKQIKARREVLRIADLRYKAGYSDYLEFLDSERSLFQSELESVNAKKDRLIAIINLYKSLGGGWKADADVID